MRLLHVDTLELREFTNDQAPQYAAASHRWISGHETTFEDVRKRRHTHGRGYKKVKNFAKYVRDHVPSVEWLWIDTCCINKDSAAELSEAVNLMFEWYRNSHICITHLADVLEVDDLEQSDWFKRGWTLQELLAPRTMVFVSRKWNSIGYKGILNDSVPVRRNLSREVQDITGIPTQALSDYNTSLDFSDEEKLRWMEGRTTTREEDMSYALYGIFGVAPGANYGERQAGARTRLLTAISQSKDANKTRNGMMTKSCEEPCRGSMSPQPLYYLGKWLRNWVKTGGAGPGWTLVDDFDCAPDAADTKSFTGGTCMLEYPEDPSTRVYFTLPSVEGDNRADWTIVAPNAMFYPGEHRGHVIFHPEFPFRAPSVYWDSPLLSPFIMNGKIKANLESIWAPRAELFLSIFRTMAPLVLQHPNDFRRRDLQGEFVLTPRPKVGARGNFDLLRATIDVEGDWFQQCTHFFCRAFNVIHVDDECSDNGDLSVPITPHHREMSCQAIESFSEHVLSKLSKRQVPLVMDGLAAREYFAEVNTISAWIAAEKKWARMLDEASGWVVSQDHGGGDRNAMYHM